MTFNETAVIFAGDLFYRSNLPPAVFLLFSLSPPSCRQMGGGQRGGEKREESGAGEEKGGICRASDNLGIRRRSGNRAKPSPSHFHSAKSSPCLWRVAGGWTRPERRAPRGFVKSATRWREAETLSTATPRRVLAQFCLHLFSFPRNELRLRDGAPPPGPSITGRSVFVFCWHHHGSIKGESSSRCRFTSLQLLRLRPPLNWDKYN